MEPYKSDFITPKPVSEVFRRAGSNVEYRFFIEIA
jgi:hypothetical protein